MMFFSDILRNNTFWVKLNIFLYNNQTNISIYHCFCDPNLLFDSFQEPEVQVVLIAVEEAFVVGEHQVSGVVSPVDDVCQLYVFLVPTLSIEAQLHTHILLSGPEATAALIKTVVNLINKKNM